MVAWLCMAFVLIGAQQPQLFDELGRLITQYRTGLEPTMLEQVSRELLAQPGAVLLLLVLVLGHCPDG